MSDFLRTPETSREYREYRANDNLKNECPLCNREAIKVFSHWKVMVNLFPYDKIASRHDMLVPLRHVTDAELTTDEKEELAIIRASFVQEYDYIIEATVKTKSIPQHFHLHLIVGKQIV